MTEILPSVLLAIAALMVVISAIQPIANKLGISDAVLLALVGIPIGSFSTFLLEHRSSELLKSLAEALLHFPVNAEVFLYIFLPALVFHGALSLDIRRLMHDVVPVLSLAVVAVALTTAFVGFALFPFAGVSITACLMLGSIVATTDPSAVVSVFRDIGVEKRLNNLVEGESLLNDAAAISIFTMLLNEIAFSSSPSASTVIWSFLLSFAGGLAVGYILARLVLFAIPLLGGARVAEVTLTLALPYIAYIACDQFFGFSGVVAAAIAGLTIGNAGPHTLRPHNWNFLRDVWDQLSFLTGSLVFVLASMLVPRLVVGMDGWDLVLVVIAILAAMAARALVLFGMVPALAALRLSQRVPLAYQTTILWGGLRGSITLAMALAVTENALISPELQRFVAVVATGFVLITLLVNGTTLPVLVRWLGLDKLSPIDQALRTQVVAIGLTEVRDRIREIAPDFGFSPRASDHVVNVYDRRAKAEESTNTFEATLSDRDRVTLGLITFASHERLQLLDIFREQGTPRSIIEHLIRTSNSIIDATRMEGRSGYLRAARQRLRPTLRFRLAQWLHATFGVDAPLVACMTERFETLLLMYLVFISQTRFMRRRIEPVLGKRVVEVITEITDRRRALYDDAMATLRLQYPGYAEALQTRILRQIGLRLEASEYTELRDEALIGDDIYDQLIRDIVKRRRHLLRRKTFNLRAGITSRLREMPLFADIPEATLHDVAMSLTMRFAVPGETILKARRRSRLVYFIASGEVSVEYEGEDLRLGPGDVFGGDGVLDAARTRGRVRAIRFSHLLVLRTSEFDELVDENPALKPKLEEPAAGPAEPLLLPHMPAARQPEKSL